MAADQIHKSEARITIRTYKSVDVLPSTKQNEYDYLGDNSILNPKPFTNEHLYEQIPKKDSEIRRDSLTKHLTPIYNFSNMFDSYDKRYDKPGVDTKKLKFSNIFRHKFNLDGRKNNELEFNDDIKNQHRSLSDAYRLTENVESHKFNQDDKVNNDLEFNDEMKNQHRSHNDMYKLTENDNGNVDITYEPFEIVTNELMIFALSRSYLHKVVTCEASNTALAPPVTRSAKIEMIRE